jgi:hypothetical protein
MKIKKISSFDFAEEGLFLRNKMSEVQMIPFSEMEKTYIQKRKFNVVQKIGLLAVFVLLFISSLKMVSFELAFISSILYVPIFVVFKNYKWYRMYIIDKTDTRYFTVFYPESKELFVSNVVAIRKGIFDNRHNQRIQYVEIYKPTATEVQEDYRELTLSIA